MVHRLVDYTGGADEVTSTSYYQTLPESSPEDAVAAERDGHRCVITKSPRFQYYHLLAYAEGDKVSSWQSSITDMSKPLWI